MVFQIQIQIFTYLNTNTNTYLTPALLRASQFYSLFHKSCGSHWVSLFNPQLRYPSIHPSISILISGCCPCPFSDSMGLPLVAPSDPKRRPSMCLGLADQHQTDYRKIFHIRRTKSQNLNDSHLVLMSSLPNPLKPGVKSRFSRMKM